MNQLYKISLMSLLVGTMYQAKTMEQQPGAAVKQQPGAMEQLRRDLAAMHAGKMDRCPDEIPSYVLRRDQDAIDQLDLLNCVNNENSQKFLNSLNIPKNAKVLSIGAALGTLERWIAQELVPNGFVIATDISKQFLEVAFERITDHGINNMVFFSSDIYNPSWVAGQFDIVYTRDCLEHLQKPEEALENMVAALKKGGLLILEDEKFSSHHVIPPHTSYAEVTRIARDLSKQLGMDCDIGERLENLCIEEHLAIERADCIEMQSGKEGLKLFENTVQEASKLFVLHDLIGQDTVDEILVGLNEVSNQPDVYTLIAKRYQVSARKQKN